LLGVARTTQHNNSHPLKSKNPREKEEEMKEEEENKISDTGNLQKPRRPT
jgi:hypothetical protein